ncbi:DMT family transporter [Ruegeria marina]|uniref:S-adenosylmethionine uptake transporter n=1 Tax=Ruegeria marina TaxID=639004 RepID=A0A1G7A542_9RHOB|nr:DMT family transporter [Ruegeria marina]SDE09880.1 S-adenosylmethionine uptake transporter [Ruegeria marina]
MSPNTRGALLMMGSMAAFTVNDAIVKLLGGSLPLFQIITLRGALTCVWIFLLARYLGALHLRFDRRDRTLVAMRCLSEVGATFFFLTALMNMPLANVTAVLQALPLTVTLGAALIFGESVGWRRMSAIGIGFCGMLLIVRPGPDGFTTYAIYALLAVTCVTARDLITRRMSTHVPSMVVTLATALTITCFGLLGSLTTTWVPLDLHLGLLIFGASVFVLMGYLCSVMVMRVGDVGFIAPFRYTSLIWALMLGWFIFGNWPDPVTMLGAGLVVATGLFTLFRERSRRRRA